MADYIGAITGIVGMVTGLFGAVMGFLGYRRANQIKSLDMRLELRKVIGESHDLLTDLRSLIEFANSSRRAVLAAHGQGRGGSMQVWEQALATDRAEIDRITAALRSEDADFTALSTEQLESELVPAYKLKNALSRLVEKYRGEVTADDAARRQIADQVTAITAARIQAARPPG